MGDCMRKFKIFIILFLLVGCYSNSSDSNDKNVNIDHFNQNSRILYEFSHGINETDEIIEYSGNPIVLNYKLDNSGKKVSLGLFIAINGILQNYKINGELAKMHTISAEENEAKTVQIEFSPNIGKRGEEYNINFFTILEPKKIVKSLKDYINQHSINQLLTKKIIFLESVDGVESTFIENIKIEQMNEQDKEPYIIENNGDVNSKLDTETDVQILQDNNIEVAKVGTLYMKEKIDALNKNEVMNKYNISEEKWDLIKNNLVNGVIDPRDEVKQMTLRSDILTIDDLEIGMSLEGTVRNVTAFGAFVDIGLHDDGLVHISKMSKEFVKHPSEILKVGDIINVYVCGIDKEKERVSLSIIEV